MNRLSALAVLLLASGAAWGQAVTKAPEPPRLNKTVVIATPSTPTSPGQHKVTLSWTASTTAGVAYNVYKGSTSGVCSGTPTPYAVGVAASPFVDTTGLSDGQTVFYNVSATKGGAESACVTVSGVEADVQVQIPVLPAPATGLSAVAQ